MRPDTIGVPAASPPATRDLTVLQLFNILLRNRVALVLTSGAVALITAILVLAQPRDYTSTASFLPQSGRSVSPLSGLAAQFGVDVPGASPGTSPQFYAELATSRHLLLDISAESFDIGGRKVSLAELLDTTDPNPAMQRDLTVRELQKRVIPSVDPRTSIVRIDVRVPDPRVAQQLATDLLNAVSAYNLNTRQSQARAERLLAQKQLETATAELRHAEDDLEEFLKQNRSLGSPSLQAQRERLSRAVMFRNQIVSQLAAAHEQAKLDEIRDTPVLTILDAPEVPVKPDARGLIIKTVLSFIVSMFAFGVFAILVDRLRARGETGSDVDEFNALREAALRDLRHPIRALRPGRSTERVEASTR
jgi:uncharacterized protein involved in exopolysaccharide biosynthesis